MQLRIFMDERHGIEEIHKKKIIGLLTLLFPEAKVYLFGSRARGTHRQYSDIDLAVDDGAPINPGAIGEAKAMLSESNIPYFIDVVDFNEISPEMKKAILTEGILWKK